MNAYGDGISRRRLLGAGAGTAALAGLAGCDREAQARRPDPAAAPPRNGVLAANFNGAPDVTSFAQLRDIRASWLRGFAPVVDGAADAPPVRTLLSAAGRGYGTVLSLKFPFKTRPVPAPGSTAMDAELKRLDRVLKAVLNRVDILVIGNEPFLETRKADRGAPLNAFYEAVARHVIGFPGRGKTRLFMGALNGLHKPGAKTPAVERWMRFVRDTKAIEGVDIHPHVASAAEAARFVDYVLPRMRDGQRFLATEFSLVRLWKRHLRDPVAPAFATRYPAHRGMPVWRVVRSAIERPFPQREWDDLLEASPWFHAGRNFLGGQVGRFRSTGRLAVAAYGIGQDDAMVRDFGPDSTPWLFNSLFCQHTVRPGADGLPGRNRTWIRAFRAQQR